MKWIDIDDVFEMERLRDEELDKPIGAILRPLPTTPDMVTLKADKKGRIELRDYDKLVEVIDIKIKKGIKLFTDEMLCDYCDLDNRSQINRLVSYLRLHGCTVTRDRTKLAYKIERVV